MAKNARDLMSENPVCIVSSTTAEEAAGLMEKHDVGSLPVVESENSKRLVGIITDRDLALRVVGRGISGNLPIGDIMSGSPHCATLDASLDDVEEMMAKHQVRRIPVVDEQGTILGVIAQADLARERRAVGNKDFAEVIEKISEPAGSR